jgi:hypothetical protein
MYTRNYTTQLIDWLATDKLATARLKYGDNETGICNELIKLILFYEFLCSFNYVELHEKSGKRNREFY